MFFLSKNMKKFLEHLDSAKRPKDLDAVVGAVQKQAPKPATPQFQKNLRQKLLAEHKLITQEQMKTQKKPESKPSARPFFLKGWAFAVALLLVVAVSGILSYPLVPAPQVEGYSLKENVRKIANNAPVKVVFTQPMDHSSVEKAFTISPEVDGTFEWQNNTLYFKPKEQPLPGKTFAVSVGKNAKSVFQKSMLYDYEENFEITGPPQVTLFNPAKDSENVTTDSKITILFDRPIVALTSLEKGESVVPKLTFDPPLEGRYKWLGTDTLSFIPARLQYSTKYTVTVPKGIVSGDGGKTEEDFVTSFITVKPQLVNLTPSDVYLYAGPRTTVQATFNQPMDPAKARDSFHLSVLKDSKDDSLYQLVSGPKVMEKFDEKQWDAVPFTVRLLTADDVRKQQAENDLIAGVTQETSSDATTQELPSNDELEKTLILEPQSPLPDNSVFFVKIDKALVAKEGTYSLDQDQGALFKTVGELTVTSSYPVQGADLSKNQPSDDGAPNQLYAAEIFFSQPVAFNSIQDKITVSPLKKDKDTNEIIQPTINPSYEGLSATISYDFDPSTDYTITVKSGGRGLYGKAMANDYVLKFKTAPLPPGMELVSGSDISVLDANRPTIYYLKTTNVDTVNFNFRKLTEDEFKGLYSMGYLNIGRDSIGVPGPFTSWQKKIEKKFNEKIVTTVDLAKETGGKLEPGIYYMSAESPDVIDPYTKRSYPWQQVFVVSRSGLAVKRSTNELLVWATSLKDGAPLENFDIRVLDRNGKQIFTGKTDKQGLASFKLEQPKEESDYYNNEFTVFGGGGDDSAIAHSSWSDGVSPWNFNIDFDAFQAQYYVYSYTDRPIYRPGHTVYFKGLVRRDADAQFRLPDVKKVHVLITSSQAENVLEKDFDLNSNGTYSGEFTLGAGARTGTYSITTSLPDAPGPIYQNQFYTTFRIAEYRKPDYELTMKPDKENYVNGDKAKVAIKGAFFFGAPLPNAPIEWTLKSKDYFYFIDPGSDSPFASQWYSFSDEGYFCYWGCIGQDEVVASGKAKLDANGQYTLELPLDISKKKVSQFYTLEVTAHDMSNQTVSNRVTMPVHAGEFYLGILNEEYVVSKGTPVKFDVASVDFDGKPLPNKSVEVSLYKRTWNTIKKKNVDSDFYFENNYDDAFVEKKSVQTDENGKAQVEFDVKDGGNFKASVQSKDSKGNTILASTTVYVTSDDFMNWGRENNDKIELVPDKNEYKPGDTAKILIKSPYQNAWALVTQERQNILDRKIVKITSNSQTIDVPITDQSIPNLFVSVLIVKGDENQAGLQEPATGSNDERDVAAFKLGYATLQVDTSSRELKIDVQPSQPQYHPGDEAVIKVKTTDASGKPVKAEVSLAVVDRSVLSLTESVTADLLNAFYRKRFLGVETAHTMTKALSRVNVQVEAGMKGGGGAQQKKRGVFKDTAHWEASVQTNDNGEGEIKLKLPDNLTTWEILAIGITNDTLVGSKKANVLVTKDVLVRPVLPRFLIVKDTLKAGAIVHNYLKDAVDFDVTLDATGVDLKGDKTQKISLASGEEKKVEWDIEVKNDAQAVFTFKALSTANQNVGDVLEQQIPIQPYSFPEVVATSGTISDDSKHVETVWLPMGVDPHFGELTVSAAPTLAGSITQGLEYLMQFPYGCVEQTTSSLLPNIVIKQALNLPGLKNTLVDEKELQKNVEAGLASLYKYQQSNGGWGLWETSQTNPYLSAYVVHTLTEAKKAGYSVDENVLNSGREYLKNHMNQHPLQKYQATDESRVKADARYEANVRAYVLYVLAETGSPDLALSNNLYDYRDQLNLFARAYLAMTYFRLENTDIEGVTKGDLTQKVEALKNDILNEAKETPRGMHFEEKNREYRLFDTDNRTTALVLQMLSRIEPSHPYIPKILRNMLMEKKDGRFASTQETSISLLALIDYLRSSNELEPNYKGTIEVNNDVKLDKSYTGQNIADKDLVKIALTELMPDNQDNEITFARSGAGKMYYDMNLKYYLPTEQIQPRDEGIVVAQEYFNADDTRMLEPVKSAQAGVNLKARMTVIVPEDRYYVMVEDFLPAGLEGIDFSLKTSQQGLLDQPQGKGMSDCGFPGGGCYNDNGWLYNGIGWFNYSEVRDNRVMYFADYLPKGVYEIDYFVRATTPGVYHDLPVLAQETYFPEVFGRSQGRMFSVEQ